MPEWLIPTLITLALNGIAWAIFFGKLLERVKDHGYRIQKLEVEHDTHLKIVSEIKETLVRLETKMEFLLKAYNK